MVEIILFYPLCASTSPFFNFEIVDGFGSITGYQFLVKDVVTTSRIQ